ncbi:hypothetical protein HNR59_001210 [Aquamicrobium lusatiense]|uniref:Uncharacterized protein n=1 Tax=Aquamicrobium lusatiense TaxID=89772 RepID=A0A7W9VV67_9HYPH|nr:hypothetical protein [Aquamicrobium lusatiense]MBB6011865.1 hypothetical protein [Aquamicrobium lusatiense]
MPRMRLSSAGPEIALPGYDVDTAPLEKMAFSPSFVAMRLALSGTVTVGPFSGLLSVYGYQGVVTFPTPFVRPPIVMVAGLNSDGTTQQSPFVRNIRAGVSGVDRVMPWSEIRTYRDRFELFVLMRQGSDPTPYEDRPLNWRYFVFENTLDAS